MGRSRDIRRKSLAALETAAAAQTRAGNPQPINAGYLDAIIKATTTPAAQQPNRRRSIHDERADTIAALTGRNRQPEALAESSTSPQPLPTAWIERVFERLSALYGSKFADLWRGCDIEGVKSRLGEEADGYSPTRSPRHSPPAGSATGPRRCRSS